MPETKVLINLSNRHIHLTTEDLEALFGKGHQLTKTKDLVQPGQFASEETVTIVGPKGKMDNIRVLGPVRPETQCEILASDVFKLGVKGCPVKESGKLEGSFPFEIVGPAGSVKKARGLIIAWRHIHFDPASAERFGVKDKEMVSLRVPRRARAPSFENVICRCGPTHALECHIDFDEGQRRRASATARMGEVIKQK